MLPGLSEGSLTSIEQCCDNRCQVTFEQDQVKIQYKRKIVQQGRSNYINKLWYFQIPTQNLINYIIHKTIAEKLTRFIHGAAGSPVIQSFLLAINKVNYTTWPQLNLMNTKKYLRVPTPKIVRHLNYQRKNKMSSKKIS